MNTYKINTLKDLEQFKDDYGYEVDGHLEVYCSLDFVGRLFVEGLLSIKAGGYIEAGGSIKAGWFIEAGESIKAGWFIEAGESIKAGESSGITAGLSITCKNSLSFGLKAFAGICTWRSISEDEKTITCGKLEGGGVVEYGILKETGLEEKKDDAFEQARRLLEKNGYKIIKD